MAYYFSYDAPDIHHELKRILPLNDVSKVYDKDHFHCTLLYIKNDYQPIYSSFNFEDVVLQIKGVEVWPDREGGSYLVALLDDSLNKLENIHNELKLITNSKDSKSLIPHVSLQKEKKKADLISPDKFGLLIGKSVNLTNFKCLLPGGIKPSSENLFKQKKLNK